MMIYFEDLKSRLDLLTELEKDLGPGKRSGRWTLFSCPFAGHAHGDSNPSLSATGDNQRYFCFTCGAEGDLIDWLREYRKMDWQQIKDLAGSDSLPAPLPRPSQPAQAEHSGPPSPAWQARAGEFMEYCNQQLWTPAGKPALDYLHGRGLTDASIMFYTLGYNPQDLNDKYQAWGLPEIPDRKGVWLPSGIVIPCFIGDGPIWYVKIRQPERKPKYINVTGGKAAMFGAANLLGAEIALLTEGELDCILADQIIGDVAGVATLGSATKRLDISTWGVYLLPARAILAAYDLDKAGKAGLDHLLGRSARIHQLRVPALKPGDKDITDYHLAGGDLWEWIKYSLDNLGLMDRLKLVKSPQAEDWAGRNLYQPGND